MSGGVSSAGGGVIGVIVEGFEARPVPLGYRGAANLERWRQLSALGHQLVLERFGLGIANAVRSTNNFLEELTAEQGSRIARFFFIRSSSPPHQGFIELALSRNARIMGTTSSGCTVVEGHTLDPEEHMLNVLLESSARRPRRTMGAVLSIGAHIALIAGAIALTASGGETAVADPPDQVPAIYVATRVETAEPVVRRGTPDLRVAEEPGPVIAAPMEIPTELPSIELGGVRSLPMPFGTGDVANVVGNGMPTPGGTGSGVYHAEQVDRSVASLPGNRLPVYPPALRAAAVRGEVLMQFVVDSSGQVERGSLRVISSSHELYEAAVRAVLPVYRFRPATVGGVRVRQLVQMPFAFEPAR